MPYFATAEQVATAWLATVPGVPTDKVATTLPSDPATWADGFVTVATVGGSPASVHVPLRVPVVQVDCWANNPGSAKPPWGKAGSLANAIVERTFTDDQPGEFPILAGFHPVRLMAAYPLTEPRRIPDDEEGFARYQFDLALRYVIEVAA